MPPSTPAGNRSSLPSPTASTVPTPAAGGRSGAGALRPRELHAAAALRLVKRTHLDDGRQGSYRVNYIDYGDQLAEVSWAFVPGYEPRGGGSAAVRGESAAREQNEDRAVRRARSNMRRKVLAFGLDHLLTLTYRANLTDFAQTNADLSKFVRLVKKHRPDFHYVAVPEKQERGAWHWHLAVKGRQDVDLLRTLWRKVVGDGNIDVQKPKAKANMRLALVKYLSKYLAKGFELKLRELNAHRFRASHGLSVPVETLVVPPEHAHAAGIYAITQLVERSGNVGYAWVGPQGSVGWACSWK